MNTIPNQPLAGDRRRRRLHSAQFKAQAVASCMQPGVSMASVAMANGVNANLLRRWVREAEQGGSTAGPVVPVSPAATGPSLRAAPQSFVPMQLPAKSALPDIRIELRRAATSITVSWPADAATECAAWMRELLR